MENRHWARIVSRAVRDMKHRKNSSGWATRHWAALIDPKAGPEAALVQMMKGWAQWAEFHRASYDSRIGDDGVIGDEWMRIGIGLHGLLNADVGNRLDCGSLSKWFHDTAQLEGVNLETEELGYTP